MKKRTLILAFATLLLVSGCDKGSSKESKKVASKAKTEQEKPAEEEISLDTVYVLGIQNTVSGNANGSRNGVKARVVNKQGEEYTITGTHDDLLFYSERGDEIVVRTFMAPEAYAWSTNGYASYRMKKSTATVENLTTKRLKENWVKSR